MNNKLLYIPGRSINVVQLVGASSSCENALASGLECSLAHGGSLVILGLKSLGALVDVCARYIETLISRIKHQSTILILLMAACELIF